MDDLDLEKKLLQMIEEFLEKTKNNTKCSDEEAQLINKENFVQIEKLDKAIKILDFLHGKDGYASLNNYLQRVYKVSGCKTFEELVLWKSKVVPYYLNFLGRADKNLFEKYEINFIWIPSPKFFACAFPSDRGHSSLVEKGLLSNELNKKKKLIYVAMSHGVFMASAFNNRCESIINNLFLMNTKKSIELSRNIELLRLYFGHLRYTDLSSISHLRVQVPYNMIKVYFSYCLSSDYFIMLHEIAHVVLGHIDTTFDNAFNGNPDDYKKSSNVFLDKESAADIEAMRLGNKSIVPMLIGANFSLYHLGLSESLCQKYSPKKHPTALKRLKNVYENHPYCWKQVYEFKDQCLLNIQKLEKMYKNSLNINEFDFQDSLKYLKYLDEFLLEAKALEYEHKKEDLQEEVLFDENDDLLSSTIMKKIDDDEKDKELNNSDIPSYIQQSKFTSLFARLVSIQPTEPFYFSLAGFRIDIFPDKKL